MYTLSDEVKRRIEYSSGLNFDYIVNELTLDEEFAVVEKISGKKPVFSAVRKGGIVGRGNPLLARKKIRTIEEVTAKLGV